MNPSKEGAIHNPSARYFQERYGDRVILLGFKGLLVNFINELNEDGRWPVDGVIRGLRNGSDLQYETNQQYWNEDLGISVPTVYFICDRNLGHISSSAIRQIATFKKV
jgi:phosphopantetheine adenylyltransferase